MANGDTRENDFYQSMVGMIEQRYRATSRKTLRDVYALDDDFLDVTADSDFLSLHRAKICAVLQNTAQFAGLVQVFVNQTIEFTYASNQFIQLDAREEAELRKIYSAYLRELEKLLTTSASNRELAEKLRVLVADHFSDLRANISRFFDEETAGSAQANVILQPMVSAEYSPSLQLQIFNLQPAGLIAPVLDIGCGKAGRLVQYLNENDIQAAGIDRLVDPSPNLTQVDWLEYAFQPAAWGTILAHMSFSNHFVFQHRYKHGQVEPYARQYMAILRALKPGSSFYYTPGLPFIEAYLPENTYQVTRRKINQELTACQVRRKITPESPGA